jgi:hypothetical protein
MAIAETGVREQTNRICVARARAKLGKYPPVRSEALWLVAPQSDLKWLYSHVLNLP